MQRLAGRHAAPRVRPVVDDAVALPTGLERVRRRHERDGALPDPAHDVVCEVYDADKGRIKITTAVRAFDWQTGTPVDVVRHGDRLVVTELAEGAMPRGTVKKVLRGERLGLPAGLRTAVGLTDDVPVGAFTDLSRRQLVLVDPRRLAALVVAAPDPEEA